MNKDKKIKIIVLFLICFLLFLLPFFWSKNSIYSLGGDDTRLYLYDPLSWLKNVATNSWFNGLAGFSSYSTQFYFIPFVLLCLFIKFLFPFLNLQSAVYGLTLSFSFLSVYWVINELFWYGKKNWDVFWAATMGGACYVFLPIIYFTHWITPYGNLYGLVGYPIIFLFFLRAVNRKRAIELFRGALVSLIFSVSLLNIPFLLPFFIGSCIFFFSYFFVIEKNKKIFIKYLLAYSFLLLLINSFWLLPFIHSIFYGNINALFTMSAEGKTSSLELVTYLAKGRSLLDLITVFSVMDMNLFGGFSKVAIESGALGSLFFGIIFLPLLFISKKIGGNYKNLLILAIVTLALIFLLVVNIGRWGTGVFAWLLNNFPGFVSIRNFDSKVPLSYGFFISLLFGASVFALLRKMKKNIFKICFLSFIAVVIFIPSLPFVSGKIFYYPFITYDENDYRGFNRAVKFPPAYLDMISYLRNLKEDSKVVTMPLIKGSWSMIPSEIRGGAYIGSSPIKALAGRDDFNSYLSFTNANFMPEINNMVKEAFWLGDYRSSKVIFNLLNIRQIVYNSEIYEENRLNFDKIKEHYLWLYKETGAEGEGYEELINNLPVKQEKTFGDWMIYEFNEQDFLPHIYTPSQLDYVQDSFGGLKERISFDDYNLRNGTFFSNSELNKSPSLFRRIDSIFIPIENNLNKIEGDYTVDIPQKNIYKILIRRDSPLLINDNLAVGLDNNIISNEIKIDDPNYKHDSNWYLFGEAELNKENYDFKIYDKNSNIFIFNPRDVILRTVDQYLIAPVPMLEFNKISPTKYKITIRNATESFPLVFSESFHPLWNIYLGSDKQEYVASSTNKNILPKEKFYETYFRKPIFGDNHSIINGYANFWWIDLNEIKNQTLNVGNYVKNDDGSIDFELILEFWPQRLFYLGLFISSITFLVCAACMSYLTWKKRHIKI